MSFNLNEYQIFIKNMTIDDYLNARKCFNGVKFRNRRSCLAIQFQHSMEFLSFTINDLTW